MQGLRWVLALFAVLVMAGCGGSDKKYYVPVDSPAKPFVPPEADDLTESDGDDWGDDGDDADADAAGDGDAGDAEPKPEPPKTRAAPPRPTQPAPGSAPPTPKK